MTPKISIKSLGDEIEVLSEVLIAGPRGRIRIRENLGREFRKCSIFLDSPQLRELALACLRVADQLVGDEQLPEEEKVAADLLLQGTASDDPRVMDLVPDPERRRILDIRIALIQAVLIERATSE